MLPIYEPIQSYQFDLIESFTFKPFKREKLGTFKTVL